MKKLYSKILFIAILFFSYAQAVFAEKAEQSFGLTYPQIYGSESLYYSKFLFIRVIEIFVLFPLLLFFVVTLLILIYYKLRRKNISKVKLLLKLGGLDFLSIVFSFLAIMQIKQLKASVYDHIIVDTTNIAALIDAIMVDNLSLILVVLSLLTLFAFIYCLIRIIIKYLAAKFKKS